MSGEELARREGIEIDLEERHTGMGRQIFSTNPIR